MIIYGDIELPNTWKDVYGNNIASVEDSTLIVHNNMIFERIQKKWEYKIPVCLFIFHKNMLYINDEKYDTFARYNEKEETFKLIKAPQYHCSFKKNDMVHSFVYKKVVYLVHMGEISVKKYECHELESVEFFYDDDNHPYIACDDIVQDFYIFNKFVNNVENETHVYACIWGVYNFQESIIQLDDICIKQYLLRSNGDVCFLQDDIYKKYDKNMIEKEFFYDGTELWEYNGKWSLAFYARIDTKKIKNTKNGEILFGLFNHNFIIFLNGTNLIKVNKQHICNKEVYLGDNMDINTAIYFENINEKKNKVVFMSTKYRNEKYYLSPFGILVYENGVWVKTDNFEYGILTESFKYNDSLYAYLLENTGNVFNLEIVGEKYIWKKYDADFIKTDILKLFMSIKKMYYYDKIWKECNFRQFGKKFDEIYKYYFIDKIDKYEGLVIKKYISENSKSVFFINTSFKLIQYHTQNDGVYTTFENGKPLPQYFMSPEIDHIYYYDNKWQEMTVSTKMNNGRTFILFEEKTKTFKWSNNRYILTDNNVSIGSTKKIKIENQKETSYNGILYTCMSLISGIQLKNILF